MDPAIEELSRQSMASRTPFTAGDRDASTTMTEDAARGHSRPGAWKEKVSSDGRPV